MYTRSAIGATELIVAALCHLCLLSRVGTASAVPSAKSACNDDSFISSEALSLLQTRGVVTRRTRSSPSPELAESSNNSANTSAKETSVNSTASFGHKHVALSELQEQAVVSADAQQRTEDCSGSRRRKCNCDQTRAPVRLDIIYESLCPASQSLIVGDLLKIWSDVEMQAVVDLKLWPFGNAQMTHPEGEDYAFTCEHGEKECVNHLMQACGVHLLTGPHQYMPFIVCMEQNAGGEAEAALGICSKKMGIDAADIVKCASSEEGLKEVFDVATWTIHLDPPKQWTPWVLVNGVHSKEGETGHLTPVLCAALQAKGITPLPTLCGSGEGAAALQLAGHV
eukprot:gnl/TRDRNA2_/TRDRNA2_181077_c0_seq1.p1 gnl/TRDRNA2_/TRDRNA2_181077_c0~~gnl/TRDRNA2_/TRDRNA2_181077_c0_seq1.p1  ORF type:complete len:339 (-),score=47.38 gnl/TRDRNA2_/TRDRNA2_181077_c0_seq1:116-1132(-)